ncbi:MFS transporter [Streptomyces sp. NPDC048604]|uniref:MFS transporter n=1 Tax=Streptomyces sp. NPDC048604 TaxID=3365578 RepID=UPI0037153038
MTPCAETPFASSTSLWRHRDFRRYLTGQAASVTGSSITQMALPVLAVLHLDATTAQVACLAFLGQLPPPLLALHAGALADRHSKRRQMITGDLVSAAVLATVPVSAALGTLTLAQLMTVAVVQGAASVLHDAAAISLLPSLVDRSLIQRSNSRVGDPGHTRTGPGALRLGTPRGRPARRRPPGPSAARDPARRAAAPHRTAGRHGPHHLVARPGPSRSEVSHEQHIPRPRHATHARSASASRRSNIGCSGAGSNGALPVRPDLLRGQRRPG